MRRLLSLLAFAGLAATAADALARDPVATFAGLPRSELQVVTASGSHRFEVWIAADDRSRERGLMFVTSLPPDQGMLFLFEHPQYAAFWMKNTYLSLDLIFIRADGVVVNIELDARPHSEEPIASTAPVTAVLELLAGTAKRIGLSAGSRIVHPAFAGASARRKVDAAGRQGGDQGREVVTVAGGATVADHDGFAGLDRAECRDRAPGALEIEALRLPRQSDRLH
jgi:hypothetical protein